MATTPKQRQRRVLWKQLLSHALAAIAGGIWMALYQHGETSEKISSATTVGPLALVQQRKLERSSTSSGDIYAPTKREKYALLPILVLEHEWKSPTLHQFVQDVHSRVRLGESEKNRVGPLHVFTPSSKSKVHSYLKTHLSSLLQSDQVVLKQVNSTETKRECFLSIGFWRLLSSLAHKVLVVDEYVAMCGNPTKSALWHANHFDWIGASWPWASKPESPHHRGGNGALSIRNPQHLLVLLEQHEYENQTKGNEDMWFVKKLGEWEKSGETKNGIDAPVLASQEEQQSFAVETVLAPKSVTPIGVYHLMRIMDFESREETLHKCPEAKRLFPALHEGRCKVLECPTNMTAYNFFQWKKHTQKEPTNFNKCEELCHVIVGDGHPVVKAAAEWNW